MDDQMPVEVCGTGSAVIALFTLSYHSPSSSRKWQEGQLSAAATDSLLSTFLCSPCHICI